MNRLAVVGAGPVGLYIACLLAAAGREVVVLDEGSCATENRSIGIHPPALEALALAGVADEVLSCANRIDKARLMLGPDHLGDLPLSGCPEPFPFVLTLPQHRTEQILERRLERLSAGALRRGVKVLEVRRVAAGMELLCEDGQPLTCQFVIGCDGRLGRVRESLKVPFAGGALDHHYLMADMPEDESLGADAAIFLCRDGVVESFPLPDRMRRWVARFPSRPDSATVLDLAGAIASRTGLVVDPADATVSAFTAERRIAGRLAGPGWALAGDAAHVISPIGGQGMNLGLMGGRALVEALTGTAIGGPAEYDRRQRARARAAASRAGFNMFLGKGSLPRFVRRIALRTVLLPGLQPWFARYFTMRGL